MDRRKSIKAIALSAFLPYIPSSSVTNTLFNCMLPPSTFEFKSNWHNWPDMKWVGPEYWGNRLQDWIVKDGKALCNVTSVNRSLHLMTVSGTDKTSYYRLSVKIQTLNKNLKNFDKGCIGLRVGVKGRFEDYRSSVVFGKGLDIGLNAKGNIIVGNNHFRTKLKQIPESYKLELEAERVNDMFSLKISIKNTLTDEMLCEKVTTQVTSFEMQGNFALLVDTKDKKTNEDKPSVAFSDWNIISENLTHLPDQLFGPICFAQYTQNNNQLKLTAQLTPIEAIKNHQVELQIYDLGQWKTIDKKTISNAGRAVNFKQENWNNRIDIPYRIKVEIPLKNEIHHYFYKGTIAKEPFNKEQIKTAVFSCNCDFGFPDQDIYNNVSKLNPDIILFLGDQFYESTGGFGVQRNGTFDKMCLDYLRKWYMFGWSYRELFRHKPCAIIPDDHDVYHGNVWGEGGKKADITDGFGAKAQDSGGYKMPAEWINIVQYTQTSHLPDPFDSTSIKQNISVYYTQWKYAGLSFAILEDRKFKSAPKHILPEKAEVWNGFITNSDFDIKEYKDLDAELLGDRQELFLENWVQDWDNVEMKAVLSQTNFATVATLPKEAKTDAVVPKLYIPKKGEYVLGDKPTVDMDSNGWPSNKRDKAIEIIRKCFAFHIAGDQHMASFIQYGVEDYADSGFAFAGPALNNIWPRRFWPSNVDVSKHSYNNPAYVGNNIDGFGNKMTVMAVSNPYDTGVEPKIIHNRATGYGMVTFNKKERTIKTECWSRLVDPTKGDLEQNSGWPITINQLDNYGRKAVAWLPKIEISNEMNPLLTVLDQHEQLVYCIRLATNTFKPKVFAKGQYTIILKNNSGTERIFHKLKARFENKKVIQVSF